jgi:hypothetical protein
MTRYYLHAPHFVTHLKYLSLWNTFLVRLVDR